MERLHFQNRMMAAYKTKTSDTNELQEMKSRWLTGHTARSALSMIALLLLAVTIALKYDFLYTSHYPIGCES